MRWSVALALALLVVGCAQSPQQPGQAAVQAAEGNAMRLQVDGFKAGEAIPARFTCDGADERPDFAWSDAPQGTKSFAVSVIDYDVPKNLRPDGIWVHWLVKDLPASATQIKGGEKLPSGAVEVPNSGGKTGWHGPCPPDRRHDYHFRVYALKVEELGPVSAADFHAKASAQALAVAEVVAGYERKK